MKSLFYIPLLLAGLLLATTLSAQEEKCPLRPFQFDPNIVQRDVPNPELDTTTIPLGKGTGDLRKIYWIHGMGGGEDSWSQAVHLTETNYGQYVQNVKINYGDYHNSISSAATNSLHHFGDKFKVGDTVLAEKLKRDYLIAHSLGGLVARQMDLYYNTNNGLIKPYGGLVTFGTAHAGAHLAHIKVHEKHVIQHFVETTCKELLPGPLKHEILKNPIGKILDNIMISMDGGEWLTNKLCDQITELGVKFMETKFSIPIEQSLVPGNKDILDIANTPFVGEELHSIAFYGEEHDENDDMAIRFLFSINKNALSYPNMEADSMDGHALATAQNLRQYYEEKYELYKSKNVNNPYWIIPINPFIGIPVNIFTNGANKDLRQAEQAFAKGIRWFDLLNGRWKILIGARVVEHDVETNCRCECEAKSDPSNPYEIKTIHPVDCNNPKICTNFENGKYGKCIFDSDISDVYIDEPSDGLVTKSTAMALPNARYEPIQMLGSGHFQMRNDSNLEEQLKSLYSGGSKKYFWLD